MTPVGNVHESRDCKEAYPDLAAIQVALQRVLASPKFVFRAERDPVDLIETVAERVAAVALGFAAVDEVEVTVHKPEAPISVPFADVSVTIVRGRP